MNPFSGLGGNSPFTAAAASSAMFPSTFSASPRPPANKLTEDPAMFLSSPARRFGPPPMSEKEWLQKTRQPYHHQAEEFKREELHRAQGNAPSLPLQTDERKEDFHGNGDDDEEEDDDEYLTDLLKHAAPGQGQGQAPIPIRPSSVRPAVNQRVSSVSSSSSGIHKSPSKSLRSLPGKSPHSKRISPVPAAGVSKSLVLKVDKGGRAKTEMQVVSEPSFMTSDVGAGSPTNEKADTSSSGSRNNSVSRPPSKGSSYSSTTHSGRGSPWAGSSFRVESRKSSYRRASEGVRRTPTKKNKLPLALASSDLMTASSSENGTAETVVDDNNNNNNNDDDNENNYNYNNADNDYNDDDDDDDDDGNDYGDYDDDSGDAQHALRQVLQGRNKMRSHTIGGYLPSDRRSSSTALPLRSSPPRLESEYDTQSHASNTSPATLTDPDMPTPSASARSAPSNGTRCVCNSADNGGHLMIQW